MEENESDNQSVESGSCNCSDYYDPDCSWFYDSKMLGTSFMRFCIISDEDYIITKKEKSKNMRDEKNKFNNNNESKNNNLFNYYSRRRHFLKNTNNDSAGKNDVVIEDKKDSKKSNENNIKIINRRKKNNHNSIDNIFTNKNNTYKPKNNIPNNYPRFALNEIVNSPKRVDFPRENDDENENNSIMAAPLETNDKNNNLHRSPINYNHRRRRIFLNDTNKTEEKKNKINSDNSEIPKEIKSPRRKNYKSFSNFDCLSDDNDEDKINDDTTNVINKNFQTRGKTIKEKIVKETKTITLEPGQTIKSKMVTKRKLKPITTIVKNEDGSQNIIVENTSLTTVTVNEMLDSSKAYQDNYPLDIQLVKQYITKIYKTEIENSPYCP